MRFDPDKTLANARRAETEELLDRVTAFREGMEPEAVEIIEAELARRGITPEDIHAHYRAFQHQVIEEKDGFVARCSFCQRAAIESRYAWHKLWGILPLFKRMFYYCEKHWAERRG